MCCTVQWAITIRAHAVDTMRVFHMSDRIEWVLPDCSDLPFLPAIVALAGSPTITGFLRLIPILRYRDTYGAWHFKVSLSMLSVLLCNGHTICLFHSLIVPNICTCTVSVNVFSSALTPQQCYRAQHMDQLVDKLQLVAHRTERCGLFSLDLLFKLALYFTLGFVYLYLEQIKRSTPHKGRSDQVVSQ